MKYIAIGDIHGHEAKFTDLIRKIAAREDLWHPDNKIIFLGDYVDGYEHSVLVLKLIEFMLHRNEDAPEIIMLLGNHEKMMMDAVSMAIVKNIPTTYNSVHFKVWWSQGGENTFLSQAMYMGYDREELKRKMYDRGVDQWLMESDDARWIFINLLEHCNKFKDFPLFYDAGDLFFVHAGINPYHGLRNSSEEDMLWIRDYFINDQSDFGARVIFGHTYTKLPYVQKNKIGIDTLNRKRGYITAVILDSNDPYTMNPEFIFSE